MPAKKRFKTNYQGVYYIEGVAVGSGKKERIYYIMYRRDGKLIEEKAGRQWQDDMTPARAAHLRTEKIQGNKLPNKERRSKALAEQNAKENVWTIERLWKEYKNQKTESKSLKIDEGRYNNYLKVKFGETEPKNLVQLDIDRMRAKLLKKLAPQTVKHILALLQRIISFGAKKQLAPGAGFKIEYPEVHNDKMEDLSPKQLENLFKEIHKDSNIQAANIMKMALYTGMRRGEMFKLKWNDVKFETGFIHIRDPKGGPDQRVPLNQAASQLLSEHPKTKSAFVFPGRNGNQRTDIKNQVNRIKEAAGLPKDFRALHGLRHVYASMLASSGKVELYTLQKLLTHKDPRMTQRYAHLHDEALKKAAAVAGDFFQQNPRSER
jgi:integrase